MRDDFVQQQQETASIRTDVNKLQKDVQGISKSQGDISLAVGTVQQAVADLGSQLSAITEVLKNLSNTVNSTQETQRETGTSSQPPVKSPTLQQVQTDMTNARTEYLRKQLELEKELTKQCATAQPQDLPPIRVNRNGPPPGFQNQQQELLSEPPTPLGTRPKVNTPVFNQFQNNTDRQLWQGYYKTYEQEMKAQFMKSITKGPKMDFPKFEGED